MGFAAGSEILSHVAIRIPERPKSAPEEVLFMYDKLVKFTYASLVEALENEDADTLDECIGIDPLLDEVLKDRGWFDDQ